jgi:hypothetical protein
MKSPPFWIYSDAMIFCRSSLFIHQNMLLLLKCIKHLGKINYYLSHSNLESKIYLVNSEFVWIEKICRISWRQNKFKMVVISLELYIIRYKINHVYTVFCFFNLNKLLLNSVQFFVIHTVSLPHISRINVSKYI